MYSKNETDDYLCMKDVLKKGLWVINEGAHKCNGTIKIFFVAMQFLLNFIVLR